MDRDLQAEANRRLVCQREVGWSATVYDQPTPLSRSRAFPTSKPPT